MLVKKEETQQKPSSYADNRESFRFCKSLATCQHRGLLGLAALWADSNAVEHAQIQDPCLQLCCIGIVFVLLLGTLFLACRLLAFSPLHSPFPPFLGPPRSRKLLDDFLTEYR